ncbi:MAG: hypothetical protein LBQ58_04775 [Synergistaceae bacterium]|jgi:hypothetical protein|nr:hypothetical protein [Synergistaceae bacterium]
MNTGTGGLSKYLAAGAYARACGVNILATPRVTVVRDDVVARMLRADSVLSLILDRLHSMRDLAERSAFMPLSDDERAHCQTEADKLKDDISRLSVSIAEAAGARRSLSAGETDDNMRRIDDSIDRISRMADELSARRNDEKISAWLNYILDSPSDEE